MASPLTSDLRFITSAGDPLAEPMEWTPCFLELPVAPQHLTEISVERNGVSLSVAVRELAGEVRVLAEWPRSSTGRYAICARSAPDGLDERADVTVRPAKLSASAFAKLLEDLELRIPAAIAVGLQAHGALTGIDLLPPVDSTFEQELLRVRRAMRGRAGRLGLVASLKRLADDPYRSLTSSDLWVRRERVRRLDPARLPQLLTRPGNLASDGKPRRVPEIRVEETVDVFENRLVRTFHDQVDQRLRLLRDAMASNVVATAEIDGLRTELRQARRAADFLDHVGALVRAPTEVTMVLLKRPEYRAVLEGFLEFRRSSVVRIDEPALDAPLKNLPKLYETWGVLRLVDVVLEEAPKHGFALVEDRISVRHPSGLFVRLLRDGKPALTFRDDAGNTLRLIPQRRYRKSGLLRSMSFDQVPDAVLELERSNGATDVWVFDPKYKLDSETASTEALPGGRPTKMDIDAMHAYRDAVRDDAGSARVRYAAILYPGPSVTYGEGLAAIRAHPQDSDELRLRLCTVVGLALQSAQIVNSSD